MYCSKWIISAAHCFFSRENELISHKFLKISVGKRSVYDEDDVETAQSFEPVQVTIHPEFGHNGGTIKNDIALVRLNKEIVFTDVVKPLAIPSKNYVPSG